MLDSLVGNCYVQEHALRMEGNGIEADIVLNIPLFALTLGVLLVKYIC
jgi:hypothetical protein